MIRHLSAAVALVLVTTHAAFAQGTREVSYSPSAVITIAAKLRFTTMILLPEGEEILDFVCGDKDYWVVSGAQHLAYVKPAKAAATTNLNLVTTSGRVYSFLLTEGGSDPDLKVYVRVEGGDAPRLPKFHSSAEVEALRQDAEAARRQAQDAREAAARAVEEMASARVEADRTVEAQVAQFRASYPTTLKFPYRFSSHQPPFNVVAIFHDDRFTYIRTSAPELPALYELVDGVANLVSFQVEDGLYVVPKVLEHGYLRLGKQLLRFDAVRAEKRQ
jgi:type IV secretion system protein VirB9